MLCFISCVGNGVLLQQYKSNKDNRHKISKGNRALANIIMNSPGYPTKFRVPLKTRLGLYSQPADVHTQTEQPIQICGDKSELTLPCWKVSGQSGIMRCLDSSGNRHGNPDRKELPGLVSFSSSSA